MGGSDFSVTLWVTLFLFSIWAGGRAFGKLRLPPILGFFLVGILFGITYNMISICESR